MQKKKPLGAGEALSMEAKVTSRKKIKPERPQRPLGLAARADPSACAVPGPRPLSPRDPGQLDERGRRGAGRGPRLMVRGHDRDELGEAHFETPNAISGHKRPSLV